MAIFIRGFHARLAGDLDQAYADFSGSLYILANQLAPGPPSPYRQLFTVAVQTALARVQGLYVRAYADTETELALAQVFADPSTILECISPGSGRTRFDMASASIYTTASTLPLLWAARRITAAPGGPAALEVAMLQHETVILNGLPLHYVHDGAGPTLLFLHGFPEFWYVWKDQLAAFAGDHQVVAPDLRGYNLSAKPTEVAAYRVAELVGDVRGLLDHVSPGQPAVLVGHDWGAIIAWAFATQYPAYLTHLVIINAPHPALLARELATNPAQQQAMGYAARLVQPGAAEVLRGGNYAWLAGALFNGTARPDAFSAEDQAAYRVAWGQSGALEAILNYYRANALSPPSGPLPPVESVRVPTLVLWGDKDAVFLPGTLLGLDAVVPGVQVQHIPHGTHWVIHEESATITQAIHAFIAPGPGI